MPGIGLLLLRTVFAVTLLVQGWCYFREPDFTAGALVLGGVAVAGGMLLLVGFLTPVAGLAVGLAGIGVACSLLPTCARPLFDAGLPLLLATSILVAIIFLGPGAFSVDARLFGRREIVIPRRGDS